MTFPARLRNQSQWAWWCAALIFVALFFRVWKLGNVPGMNGDEAWLGCKAIRFVHGESLQWRTNSGNLMNVWFFFPLAGLNAVFPPSFVLLRVVAATSGVFALPLNWWLCRRTFDTKTAWASTTLLAVLPVNIAYSRFGWEPSQIVLFSLPVLYTACLAARELRRRWRWLVLGIVLLLIAMNVHPTAIFLSPFLMSALVLSSGDWLQRSDRSNKLLFLLVAIVLAGVLIGVLIMGSGTSLIAEILAHRKNYFTGAWEIPLFLVGLANLLSGLSTYAYISGADIKGMIISSPFSLAKQAQPRISLWDATAFLLCCSAWVWMIGLARNHQPQMSLRNTDRVLLWGLALSLVAFLVLAGVFTLMPPNARYSLWIIAPWVLFLCRAAVLFEERYIVRRVAVRRAGVLIGVLLLAGFYYYYFHFMLTTGGAGLMEFRTGRVEPKWAAAEYIRQHLNPQRSSVLTSSDWWSYWPVRYLLMDRRNMQGLLGDDASEPRNASTLNAALQSGDLWFVEFPEYAVPLRSGMQAGKVEFDEFVATDYGGKPAVVVLHPHAMRRKSTP